MINEDRAWGSVATPSDLVARMVDWAELDAAREWSILEPACGDACFLAAIESRYSEMGHSYCGVEISDAHVLAARPEHPNFEILLQDFVLWDTARRFDLVIGNPPYGIVGHESHYAIHTLQQQKSAYRMRCTTWQGKYNMYGAFLERAVRLLKPTGRVVFVAPATWLVLDEFRLLRKFLANEGRVVVHYIGSAFPGRQVTAAVVLLDKVGTGLELWDGDRLGLSLPRYDGSIIRFESEETRSFEVGKIPLGSVFEIHFAARSPEVRANPNVSTCEGPGLVPVLTGKNLRPGWIDYDTGASGFWMAQEKARGLRAFYGFPHVVVGHTKGGRVVAARDDRCYPWREELHLVPLDRWHGPDEAALVEYLNSSDVNGYVRSLYRDITPHFTITQLRQLPIPITLARAGFGQLALFDGPRRRTRGGHSMLTKEFERFLGSIPLQEYRQSCMTIKTVE